MSDPTNPGPRRAVSRRAVLLGGAAALGASTDRKSVV